MPIAQVLTIVMILIIIVIFIMILIIIRIAVAYKNVDIFRVGLPSVFSRSLGVTILKALLLPPGHDSDPSFSILNGEFEVEMGVAAENAYQYSLSSVWDISGLVPAAEKRASEAKETNRRAETRIMISPCWLTLQSSFCSLLGQRTFSWLALQLIITHFAGIIRPYLDHVPSPIFPLQNLDISNASGSDSTRVSTLQSSRTHLFRCSPLVLSSVDKVQWLNSQLFSGCKHSSLEAVSE